LPHRAVGQLLMEGGSDMREIERSRGE